MKFETFPSARLIRSTWLETGGRRLDCHPYMSGALEAKAALDRLDAPKIKLASVTSGIFHAGREARQWVTSREFGIPFLGSSDILAADLTSLPLISKKQVLRNPNFTLREKYTLITRSGTIGRMAYARPDMAGLACSEHVLRVAPDESKIPPGYLYAFLSSKYGVPLVIAGTYGAIIQHIEPEHLGTIEVPRFDRDVEHKIHDLVESAATARSSAANLLQEGIRQFISAAKLDDISNTPISSGFATSEAWMSELSRMDATYFNPYARQASAALGQEYLNPKRLQDCARVFTPGIFKRMYADDRTWGYPYFSGSELFEYSPTPRGYLSKRAPNINEYLIEKDWLLIQDAGQVGGLIGRITRATRSVHKSAVSNHLMRVVGKTRTDAAYIFTVLSSPYGYRAIVRNAFGSSIPQLDPKQIGEIEIPWLPTQTRQGIAEPILEAWKLVDFAESAESEAVTRIERKIEAEGS